MWCPFRNKHRRPCEDREEGNVCHRAYLALFVQQAAGGVEFATSRRSRNRGSPSSSARQCGDCLLGANLVLSSLPLLRLAG